jgi:hypothetical protein
MTMISLLPRAYGLFGVTIEHQGRAGVSNREGDTGLIDDATSIVRASLAWGAIENVFIIQYEKLAGINGEEEVKRSRKRTCQWRLHAGI